MIREPVSVLAISRIRTGVLAGILSVLVYSTFFFVAWPVRLGVVVAAAFGLLLAIGCIGLREFLYVDRPSFAADLGAVFGVLAGMTVMLMLIVQLAIRYPSVITPELTGDPGAFASAQDRIHFGMDVAWDILIAAATLFFSLAALRHPRLGVVYAVSGTLIAVALAVTNLMTFPIPPAGAGSFDVGPAVGLWYVAAAVRTAASMGWVREQLGVGAESWP